jgi:hypothetical protein
MDVEAVIQCNTLLRQADAITVVDPSDWLTRTFDTAGELGVSVLLSNRPYPPAPGLCNFTEIGWSDLAYRLRRHATQF